MTNYSAEKLETIESYIENPTQNFYFDVFDGRYDIVMVVDGEKRMMQLLAIVKTF